MKVTSPDDFCGIDKTAFGLKSMPVHESHGLIWSIGDPDVRLDDIDLLHGMEDDLVQLDLDRWHLQYAESMPAALSWPMLLEAGSRRTTCHICTHRPRRRSSTPT